VTTDRLGEILRLIEASLDEPELNGAELAERFHLSRFHFDRLVAAAVGEPPHAFRRRLLLERAAHRLVATGDAVIEIAIDAGYAAPEAFARAFSKAYGPAPSAYRRRGGGSHDLPARSGVHFHPPGGLRLPAIRRSDPMEIPVRMLDHHLWLSGEIVDCLCRLDDDVLDRRIELSVACIDHEPTLRSLGDRSSASSRCGRPQSAGARRCRRRAT
jgi:AraC-like DNA-binding protein